MIVSYGMVFLYDEIRAVAHRTRKSFLMIGPNAQLTLNFAREINMSVSQHRPRLLQLYGCHHIHGTLSSLLLFYVMPEIGINDNLPHA